MEQEEPLHRYLGIYPILRVTGVPVSQEQAVEIIRRTDRFFRDLTSNDYSYLARISRRLRIPLWEDYKRELRRDQGYRAYEANLDRLRGTDAYMDALSGEHYEAYRAALRRHEDDHHRWLTAWGYLEPEYVRNDWVSSQYVYGPHGWCHPDGTIGHVDRVGKGQIAEEVYHDWCILAQAFPFLELGASLIREGLYEGEVDSAQVSFRISGGQVAILDPELADVHAGHPLPTRGGPTSPFSSDQGDQASEDRLATLHTLLRTVGLVGQTRMIPWSWIEAWAAQAPS